MRDNQWLQEKLYHIWEDYFVDIPRKNVVVIKFGKSSYRQLGCIKWANSKTRGLKKIMKLYPFIEDDKRISLITISKLFMSEEVPEYVVLSTIAHELCHYSHGFNSPLKQVHKHPHRGSIIRNEMKRRGLQNNHEKANKWLKKNWRSIVLSKV